MNYIGVSKKTKEIPDVCKMNFSLLLKYISLSKTEVHSKFVSLISQYKMKIRDKRTFENQASLHQLYMKVFSDDKKSIKWNNKKSLILLWLISTYEALESKPENNFNDSDWTCLSNFFPNIPFEELRYRCKLLKLKRNRVHRCVWQKAEENAILELLKKFYPSIFSVKDLKVKWSKIALELHKKFPSWPLKTPKQISERWLNHLSPFLKKKQWGILENIKLLELTLKHKKKWSYLSKEYFSFENQHSLKNRVIKLLGHYLVKRREEINKLMKGDWVDLVSEAIKLLKKETVVVKPVSLPQKENIVVKPVSCLPQKENHETIVKPPSKIPEENIQKTLGNKKKMCGFQENPIKVSLNYSNPLILPLNYHYVAPNMYYPNMLLMSLRMMNNPWMDLQNQFYL